MLNQQIQKHLIWNQVSLFLFIHQIWLYESKVYLPIDKIRYVANYVILFSMISSMPLQLKHYQQTQPQQQPVGWHYYKYLKHNEE